MAGKKAPSIPAVEPDLPKWIWCLVANVRDYRVDELFNVIKKERRGTKRFVGNPSDATLLKADHYGPAITAFSWERRITLGLLAEAGKKSDAFQRQAEIIGG